jgi:hypothetical protein
MDIGFVDNKFEAKEAGSEDDRKSDIATFAEHGIHVIFF